jgi:integrase
MRPRRIDKHLPQSVYLKHGAYWYVRNRKWHRLGSALGPALAEYARLLDESNRGEMATLIDAALPGIVAGKAASTQAQYRIAADKLRHAFAEFSPRQVQQRHVAQLQEGMRATPNMANRTLSVLRQVFDYAVRLQIVDSNPAAAVRRLDEAKRGRYLTDAELAAIRAQAGDRLRVVIDLLYLTAQRPADVLALDKSAYTDAGVVFRPRKTAGSTGVRICVAWTPGLQDAVERARTHLRGRGGSVDYRTTAMQWRAACEAAGVPDAQMRDVRAKALTDARRQGFDATALAAHASAAMTERYIRQRDTMLVRGPAAVPSE